MRFFNKITTLVLFSVSVKAAPLDVFNPNFNIPWSTDPTDAMLSLDIETECPQNVEVTVTITGTGTQVNSPQFQAGSWGPTDFIGDTNKCAAAPGPDFCGSTLQFNRVAATPTSTLKFTSFDWIRPARDATDTVILGRWRFFVAIPVSSFAALGPTPLVIESPDPHPSISTVDVNDFKIELDGRECKGPSEVQQDPVFTGFQGQLFQFHGLPDEHFNLVSTPSMQVNSHFVYLSNGNCNYNDTACWTHPGTYVDQLGFTIGESRIKVQSGPHDSGLRVWLMNTEIRPSTRPVIFAINNSSIDTATVRYTQKQRLEIFTPLLIFQIDNSDNFMNIAATLTDQSLLRTGSHRHDVTDHNICKTQSSYDYQTVENTVAKLYHMPTPLHGLVGQTWRNVKVCGRDWMGVVEDYLVTDGLFGTSYHYNLFKTR